jgi:hypothetical protein
MLKARFAPEAGERVPQSGRGAEVTAMRYFTRGFIDRMHNSFTGFKTDPRAGVFDEAFYQEVYQRALRKRLEEQRRMCLSQGRDPVENSKRRLKPLVDASVMDPLEFKEIIKRRKEFRKYMKTYTSPPFDETQITENFNKGLVQTEEFYRARLPEEIYRKVADPRMLALYIVSQEVLWEIEANKRFVDEAFRAVEVLQAGVPERIARLLNLHDTRVDQAVRKGGALTLHFGKCSDNCHRVRKARFLECEFPKWSDPHRLVLGMAGTGAAAGRALFGGSALSEGAGRPFGTGIIAQDIEIDSPVTLEDIKLRDERFQHLLDIGVLRSASDEDWY